MPTARERMLELSELPSGNTARAHFLSIDCSGGGAIVIPIVTASADVTLQEVLVTTSILNTPIVATASVEDSEISIEVQVEDQSPSVSVEIDDNDVTANGSVN